MRWIYLSPHFDDAVLSCGGLIWEQSRSQIPVEIWTVCAGDAEAGPLSPLAMSCHQQWKMNSAEEVVAARRIENQDAALLVGAETVNFSIPDCIYRHSRTGELLYPEEVIAPIHPVERNLDADIAAVLAAELKPDDVLVSPLAIGGHVDHVLARRSAERLGRPLMYYADIPYLLNQAGLLAPARSGLDEKVLKISRRGLGAWQKGISAYRSQLWMLFRTREDMKKAISAYWEDLHGMHLWQKQ